MADRPRVYGGPNRGDSDMLNSGWLAKLSGFSTGCGAVRSGEASWDCLRLPHVTVYGVSDRGGDTGLLGGGELQLFG